MNLVGITLLSTFIISIVIFTPFIFFGKEIFSNVMGVNWSKSGQIDSLLSFAAIVGFISGTIDRTYLVNGTNIYGPLWSAFRVFCCLFASTYSVYKGYDLLTFPYYFLAR